MKFTDKRLYVLGIGTAYMTDPATGDILYWSDKFQEGNVNFSASDNVLSAGIGNGPAIIIPTDPNITVNVTAGDYSEYVKSASVGAAITPSAPVATCQEVAATGAALSIDVSNGTPVKGPGMSKVVCYVQAIGEKSGVTVGGVAYELDPATGAISGFTATPGTTYLVTYHVAQANATLTTIGSNIKGKVVRFVLSRPIYTSYNPSTNSGDLWGYVHEIIPLLQLMPDGASNSGSQTSYTTTGIVGRALMPEHTVVTADCGDCGFPDLPMMYRIVEPCDPNAAIDGVIGVIGGEVYMVQGEETQISPIIVANNRLITNIPPNQFVYSSSSPDIAEIGSTSGLLKAVADGSAKIAVFYNEPKTGKSYTDVFKVEIAPLPTWKFTCLSGVNLHLTGENLTVDYGDGTTESIPDDTDTYLTHTYSDEVAHQVKVSGVIKSVRFYMPGEASKARNYLQTVDTPLPENQITSMEYTFDGCTSLTSIPVGLFDSCTAVTGFGSCFRSCTGLTAIPSGLFDNCTKVTGFGGCFRSCTGLTAIPSGLFDNCTKVTGFAHCFNGCTSLSEIPSGLFDSCTEVTSFAYCFNGCKSLTAIPIGLFDNCTKVTGFSECFQNCTSLTAIPSGLFDNCTEVTSFSECFYGCTSLTAIPSGLFDNCTKVTGFFGCFRYCKSLAAIPSGLFDSCTEVTGFAYCFNGCTSVSEIPSGLFDSCTEVTTFGHCFYQCTSLTAIPSRLFSKCTKVTEFQYCFYGCSNITTLPDGLFNGCTAVTGFAYCFNGCTSVSEIPSGLFDSCTEVTTFGHCFYQCTSLTAIPNGLFDNCTKVITFSDCFCGCTSLTAIPSGLFDNCTEVTSFSECFYGCTSLTAIPSGLFDNCTAVTGFGGCFRDCTSLTAIPSGLFDNCTEVIEFQQCFYGCRKITSEVPPLWDFTKWDKVTYYSVCFRDCTSAANYLSIPSSWK